MKRVEAELRALAPHNILERGYAMVRGTDGRVISSATKIEPKENLELTFADGTVEAEAKGVSTNN
ncbi:MAG: hypothetical protein F4180_05670 [Chloroflexi bacterium]|nr:hypothetical protein [Chloroflexota bacterium]